MNLSMPEVAKNKVTIKPVVFFNVFIYNQIIRFKCA